MLWCIFDNSFQAKQWSFLHSFINSVRYQEVRKVAVILGVRVGVWIRLSSYFISVLLSYFAAFLLWFFFNLYYPLRRQGGGPGVKKWLWLISEILVRRFQRFLRNLKSLSWCRAVSIGVFENIGVSIHFANFKRDFLKMNVSLNKISANHFLGPFLA